jgi:hypothetical protein
MPRVCSIKHSFLGNLEMNMHCLLHLSRPGAASRYGTYVNFLARPLLYEELHFNVNFNKNLRPAMMP